MADIGLIVQSLLSFYDFTGKTVIAIGAGGGQFATWAKPTRKVIAVDSDKEALARLADAVKRLDLADKYEMIAADFYELTRKGDTALFEFCLHEIPDPAAALARAKAMAPDVVVIDHGPQSEWAYYTAEEDKVARAWEAIEAFPHRGRHVFPAVQHFPSYAELAQKLRPQGETSLRRIEPFRSKRDFTIPASFGIALI